ncbi:MAG: phenylacetate--CoA ligase family protein [Planctomycetota bacterium]
MNLYSKLISTFAMPLVSVLTQSKFWKYHQKYSKNSWHTLCSPSQHDTLQKINALVRHASTNVPFYRERIDALGLRSGFPANLEEFRKLPPTTKSDIEVNFPDRITALQMDSSTWQYTSTSGTIHRLTIIQDFKKRDYVRTTQLLSLSLATGYQLGTKYMEIPPDVCSNVCGMSNMVEPNVFRYFMENLVNRNLFSKEVISNLRGLVDRQLLYSRMELPSFGPEGLVQKPELLDNYIKKIKEYRPYTLKAAPTYLYLLALHINKHNLKPPYIKGGLMPMGGSMTQFMKSVIESAFGCKVHEDYGCAELGNIAAECGKQNGLHPFNDLFYVEVVRQGHPVEDGELGKVLITDLCNYAMPLLRYDIGDIAVLRKNPCECGLHTTRIEVQGRVQDCLMGADGTVLTHDRLVDMLIGRDDVLGVQMELRDEDELYLQIVPKNSKEPNMVEIRQTLSNLLKGNPRVSARIVPTILPESGGKFRFVKNMTNNIKL